jgi:hypothetical protein
MAMESDLNAYEALRNGDLVRAQVLATLAVAENVRELSAQLYEVQKVLEHIEQRIPVE